MIVQTVPRPTTWAEYEAVKSQLMDTLGGPLVSEYCARCRCAHFTVEPHLSEVPCPDCGSTATRCLRGSGFEASGWHKARVLAFDQLRDDREAAGIAQVARWAALVIERDTLDLLPGSADPVRCPKCGGPHPFHDPACVVHPDLIQDQSGTGAE